MNEFDWDQCVNVHFSLTFKKYKSHVWIRSPAWTQLIFQTFFLCPSWRHGPTKKPKHFRLSWKSSGHFASILPGSTFWLTRKQIKLLSSQRTEQYKQSKCLTNLYETTILIGCEICTPIFSTNRKLHYKVTFESQSHPREPLMCFDLEVSKPHELSDFNIDQIGCAWCQTIGNWGRETRISHPF